MRPRLVPRALRNLLLASLSCLAAACGPTVDPAAKADLDRLLAQLPNSDETFPPSESFLPMALGVGQWTQHRVTDARGAASLLTYKLVGQENGGYWLETINQSYGGREAVKMLVVLTQGREPAGMEIRALRLKKGKSAAVDVDPGAREQYRGALDLLASSFEGQEKDDLRVPAGHFIGCYKAEIQGPWGPWQTPSVVCAHPSVPLSGIVRATPIGHGGSGAKAGLMELVSFGVTGAEAEL
jgi:hypothetical protein